jgi:nucleoid-associated protein YgaU
VALGDNLWTIARDRLAKVTRRPAAELGEREIARYWLDVVDANRASLRSGDPDLIFPGELIRLPPVTGREP